MKADHNNQRADQGRSQQPECRTWQIVTSRVQIRADRNNQMTGNRPDHNNQEADQSRSQQPVCRSERITTTIETSSGQFATTSVQIKADRNNHRQRSGQIATSSKQIRADPTTRKQIMADRKRSRQPEGTHEEFRIGTVFKRNYTISSKGSRATTSKVSPQAEG